MVLSRHVDNLLKNLSLTLNFIKEGISTKNILKAATDCTIVTAINWRNTSFSCYDQHLLFICRKMLVIIVTSKTKQNCDKQNKIALAVCYEDSFLRSATRSRVLKLW